MYTSNGRWTCDGSRAIERATAGHHGGSHGPDHVIADRPDPQRGRPQVHRWCTPSILPGQERVEDFYESDVSISAGFFGTLVDHTGVFGEAERFAAAAQGADRTMF